MPDEDILSLEAFLPYRLNRLADAVSREFSAIYRERYGLTRPEWRTLATLGQYGTMTATAIGAHSSMHKTKVSRAVAALEARGWLKRQSNSADRRVEHLSLTPTGESVYRDMVPRAKAFEARLLDRTSQADTARVLDGLSALERTLELDSRQAEPLKRVKWTGQND